MSRCTSCGKRVWSGHTIHRYCYLASELARAKTAAADAKLSADYALKIAALTQLRDSLHARMEWMRGETKDMDLARGWNAATALMLDDIDRLLNNRPPWIWKQGDKQ